MSFLLGVLWYGPLFGKRWMQLSGLSQTALEAAKQKGLVSAYVLTFIGSLVMSYVLAHSLIFAATYLKASGAQTGILTGFWSWLGFVAPVTLGSVLWEQKSWRLWALNNAYYLLSLCVMGVILASWK